MARRRGINKFNFFPTYASFGNALHHLQTMAEPQMKYVIEEEDNDEADDDDNGLPEDEEDFDEQIRRIRNGD
jgi:hypothetical protein